MPNETSGLSQWDAVVRRGPLGPFAASEVRRALRNLSAVTSATNQGAEHTRWRTRGLLLIQRDRHVRLGNGRHVGRPESGSVAAKVDDLAFD